jgi:hypothetical protein
MISPKADKLFHLLGFLLLGILGGFFCLLFNDYFRPGRDFIIPAILILLAGSGFYFFHTLRNPHVCFSFIIGSSFFVIFEPAPVDIFSMLAIFASVLHFFYYRKPIAPVWPGSMMLLVFMVLNLNFAFLGSGDLMPRLNFLFISVYLFVFSLFISQVSDSFDILRKQLHLFFIPTAINVCGLLLGAFTILSGLGAGLLENILLAEGRPSAFFKDPNVAGPFLILPASYSLALFLNHADWNKRLLFPIFLFMALGIFTTYSRGAILGLIFNFILVSSFYLNKKTKARSFITAGIFAVVLLAVLIFLAQTELTSRIYNTEFGVDDRLERIERGIVAIKQHPLIGSGMELDMSKAPHDSFFLLLQQTGLLGFISFWGPIIFLAGKALMRARSTGSAEERAIFLALGATLLSHMIIGIGVFILHWRHFWYLIGLTIASISLPWHPRNKISSMKI